MKKSLSFLILFGILVFSFLFFYFTKKQPSLKTQEKTSATNLENFSENNAYAKSNKESKEKESDESNVNIDVVLISKKNIKELKEDFPDIKKLVNLKKHSAFALYFETHSVDLTEYDLKKLSFFKDNKKKKYKPLIYKKYIGEGMMASHHIKGILIFKKIKAEKGKLFIKNVGDKPLREYKIIFKKQKWIFL
jgi:hypothetical protein